MISFFGGRPCAPGGLRERQGILFAAFGQENILDQDNIWEWIKNY
jgi:hypothetical protein